MLASRFWKASPASAALRRQATAALSTKAAAFTAADPVVIVGGVRLPFAMTSTIYQDQLAVDLQRLAIQGLLTQTALPRDAVDYVIAGSKYQCNGMVVPYLPYHTKSAHDMVPSIA